MKKKDPHEEAMMILKGQMSVAPGPATAAPVRKRWSEGTGGRSPCSEPGALRGVDGEGPAACLANAGARGAALQLSIRSPHQLRIRVRPLKESMIPRLATTWAEPQC